MFEKSMVWVFSGIVLGMISQAQGHEEFAFATLGVCALAGGLPPTVEFIKWLFRE